jgi:N4-(beta-N-acetylglucosaminyl)-L-asparaginase
MMTFTRRKFLKQTTAACTGALVAGKMAGVFGQQAVAHSSAKPLVISSANGLKAIPRAMELMQQGADALDAVIAAVNIVEDDPKDTSVGYGGLPNEDGVVELDAAVMQGRTYRAGAVASLRNIKNPSKVARLVMERTDHVLLVGEGALRFAKAHGFKEEDLLTDESRREWLKWKENLSTTDDWLPPHTENDKDIGEMFEPFFRNTGTIHCSAIDLKGNISCVTTTSGLAYKIPGRVGDSPIIGAGLYVDNEVGAAGSTGRGEANLINCSCVMIVEWMRQGRSPEQACLEVCKRLVEHNKMRRLQREDGKPNFNVRFFALNKRAEFGGAAIFGGGTFAVHDGKQVRELPLAYLYEE